MGNLQLINEPRKVGLCKFGGVPGVHLATQQLGDNTIEIGGFTIISLLVSYTTMLMENRQLTAALDGNVLVIGPDEFVSNEAAEGVDRGDHLNRVPGCRDRCSFS
jgi:hypothetical protein